LIRVGSSNWAKGWTTWIRFSAGAENFSLRHRVHKGSVLPSFLPNLYWGFFPRGVKVTRRETDQYGDIPSQYVFMA